MSCVGDTVAFIRPCPDAGSTSRPNRCTRSCGGGAPPTRPCAPSHPPASAPDRAAGPRREGCRTFLPSSRLRSAYPRGDGEHFPYRCSSTTWEHFTVPSPLVGEG